MSVNVGPTGIWDCPIEDHTTDEGLASAISSFLLIEKPSTVLDVGCGSGGYVKHLRSRGLIVKGIDGNPRTPEFCEGCEVVELVNDLHRFSADWVICLETGEHIPNQREKPFIDSLARSAKYGIVLSWFPNHGAGIGHVNPKPNSYIKNEMRKRGFRSNDAAEEALRKVATLWWFKESLMVFNRI